jgi:tetratricopeptide (TPR) repeat protein
MKGYTAEEVAKLVDVPPGRVRALIRAGVLDPLRDGHGRPYFTFQDLVLLRTAKGLLEARISERRIGKVLRRLREGLPSGRPLTALAIAAEGNRITVRDGQTRFEPESGQVLFDFEVAELADQVEPLLERAQRRTREKSAPTAEEWFDLGANLEIVDPIEARAAYMKAIELDPEHAHAHLNLGRLLHESSELAEAEAHYRLALAAEPLSATAAFNLGVVLEDRERPDEAVLAYERALTLDPAYADAHFNLSRIHERAGHQTLALRHLRAYKKLTQGR